MPPNSFHLWDLWSASGAVLLQRMLTFHLSRPLVAVILLVYLVLITGCLHEDGLADTADGFGGGRTKDQILAILKDSRIGSYGATALVLSLLARYLLLASLPLEHFAAYVISAHVLCRWSSLPLSYFLPPAREARWAGRPNRQAYVFVFADIRVGLQFCCSRVCAAMGGFGSRAVGDSHRCIERVALCKKNWRSDWRLLRRDESVD